MMREEWIFIPERRRRPLRRFVFFLVLAASVACVLPFGWAQAAQLRDLFVSRYAAALEEENAALHRELAACASAARENAALRAFLGGSHPDGDWQPAHLVARWPGRLLLSGKAPVGAAVLDRRGRFAGSVISLNRDTVTVALAADDDCPVAGLAGGLAGILQRSGTVWELTGLSNTAIETGTIVTTPDGYWLGRLAHTPAPAPDGLTAAARLTDTADLSDSIYFVAQG